MSSDNEDLPTAIVSTEFVSLSEGFSLTLLDGEDKLELQLVSETKGKNYDQFMEQCNM